MIGALLTIIGYSLNDTIVIYDRIRENMSRYRQKDLPALINTSVNETLHRTINTSLTTFFAMLMFLFFGGAIIQTFALAIIMGVITGCFGGMLRDVLAREIPMLLKGELYAITCIAGGVVYTQGIHFSLWAALISLRGWVCSMLLTCCGGRGGSGTCTCPV